MTYGFTGHRPPRLGGYGKEAQQTLYNFAHKVVYEHLSDKDYTNSHDTSGNKAIIGMAQGWDMAVAQACRAITVPYIAAVPFPGQESVWPDEEVRNLYTTLLENAEEVVYIHNTRVNYCRIGEVSKIMQMRNEWIVDHSYTMIALYEGDHTMNEPRMKGGTANCLRYANLKKVPIINVWDQWKEFTK